MSSPEQPIPPDSQRNILGFSTDIFNWNLGTFFIPVSTVLAALASRLTDDKALIGLIVPAWSAGWALPQLIGARLIHGRTRKLPFVIACGAIGRQFMLLLAAWLFFTHAAAPQATVGLLIVCVTIFSITDGLASVAWFDVLANTITSRTRNRIVATVSFAATIASLIANVLVVTPVFSSPDIGFPNNYAIVILVGWAFVFVSFLGLLLVRENPSPPAHDEDGQAIPFFAQLRQSFKSDPVFRRLLIARLLTAVELMASNFYIVFAQERLKLPDAAVGSFNTAYAIGSLVGVAFLGAVAERLGSRRVIHVASMVQVLAPLLSFGIAAFTFIANDVPQTAFWVMVVVIGLNGMVNHSMMLGFLNYTLDMATDSRRAMYVGVLNLSYGLMALTAPIGGLIINALSHGASPSAGYAALFLGVAVLVALGLGISLRLPKHARAT